MLTVKEISKRITSIRDRGEKWNRDVQTVLVNLAGHAYEHGDVSKAGDLLNATTGADKVAIVRYLTDHCFVKVSNDGKVSLNKTARNEADFVSGDAVIESLADVPAWYEDAITTEKAAQILDPVKSLESLIKKVAKADDVKYVSMTDLENLCNQLAAALEVTNAKAQDAELAALLQAA